MVVFLIVVFICLFVILTDVLLSYRKRRIKRSFLEKLKYLANRHNKVVNFISKIDNVKKQDRLTLRLKNINIEYTLEAFYVFSLFTMILSVVMFFVIKYTNTISMLVNMENLRVTAEKLNNPELAQVNTNINILIVMLIALIGFLIPRILLFFITLIRKAIGEREAIILQTYTILLMQAGKNVQGILISLSERAYIYKYVLVQAVNNFSVNPEKTLQVLKNSTEDRNFKKIIIALEQIFYYDRETSLKYLGANRKLGKELSRINKKEKNTKKNVIGTLFLIVPLIVFLVVGGYPWLIYVLKIMSELPS